MPACEICESELVSGRCAECADDLRERFRQGSDAAFPFSAQAPSGVVDAQTLGRLRRSLLQGDYGAAEAIWTRLLPGLRPIGAEGRRQLGEALDALAVLKEHLGKADEARRLRQRAQTARKDPSELKFKQSQDDHKRLEQAVPLRATLEEDDAGRDARIAAVRRQLDIQQTLSERRQRAMKLGACGFLGAATGPAIGLPLLAGGALGAGIGWAWFRLR